MEKKKKIAHAIVQTVVFILSVMLIVKGILDKSLTDVHRTLAVMSGLWILTINTLDAKLGGIVEALQVAAMITAAKTFHDTKEEPK